jgi:hypothetical protein
MFKVWLTKTDLAPMVKEKRPRLLKRMTIKFNCLKKESAARAARLQGESVLMRRKI